MRLAFNSSIIPHGLHFFVARVTLALLHCSLARLTLTLPLQPHFTSPTHHGPPNNDSPTSPLKLFELAKSQKRFLYTSAPMVRYSKASPLTPLPVKTHENTSLTTTQLAFRKTVHEYGTDLCWTPMILAKEFNRNQFARDSGSLPPSPPTLHLPLIPLRLHHLHPPTPDHRPIRRQRPPRARARLVARRPVRLGRRPQLRVPAVLGVRRDAGRRAHGEARAGAGHGGRDAGAAAAGRVGGGLGAGC